MCITVTCFCLVQICTGDLDAGRQANISSSECAMCMTSRFWLCSIVILYAGLCSEDKTNLPLLVEFPSSCCLFMRKASNSLCWGRWQRNRDKSSKTNLILCVPVLVHSFIHSYLCSCFRSTLCGHAEVAAACRSGCLMKKRSCWTGGKGRKQCFTSVMKEKTMMEMMKMRGYLVSLNRWIKAISHCSQSVCH